MQYSVAGVAWDIQGKKKSMLDRAMELLVNNIKELDKEAEVLVEHHFDTKLYSYDSYKAVEHFIMLGYTTIDMSDEDLHIKKVWTLPDVNVINTPEAKIEVRDKLALIAREIVGAKKALVESCVEKDGVSFGKLNCDIQISDTEAQYLKHLKDLVGASKIRITKGDLKIEFEG